MVFRWFLVVPCFSNNANELILQMIFVMGCNGQQEVTLREKKNLLPTDIRSTQIITTFKARVRGL